MSSPDDHSSVIWLYMASTEIERQLLCDSAFIFWRVFNFPSAIHTPRTLLYLKYINPNLFLKFTSIWSVNKSQFPNLIHRLQIPFVCTVHTPKKKSHSHYIYLFVYMHIQLSADLSTLSHYHRIAGVSGVWSVEWDLTDNK